jgi:hypothetical protein
MPAPAAISTFALGSKIRTNINSATVVGVLLALQGGRALLSFETFGSVSTNPIVLPADTLATAA